MAEVGYDTILEGDLPERSANYTSLAAFAAKTQTDWEDEIWGAEENRWGDNGLLGALFGGLEAAGSFVLSILQTLANSIFEGVNFVFTAVNDAVTAIAETFASWWESVSRANTTGLITLTGQLADGVAGGVAVFDEFDGSSSTNLGVDWSVVSDGAGAGSFGLSGTGRAEWKISGAAARRHVNVYDTPLATDYQVVSCVIGTVPSVPAVSEADPPWTYLIGRCNSAGDTFVWVRFNDVKIQLGYTASGVFTAFPGAEVDRSGWSSGAEIEFFVGTDDDDRDFVVKANGLTVLEYTDSADVSALGGSYRYPGLAASAVGYSVFTQLAPPSLSAWAASDRASDALGS